MEKEQQELYDQFLDSRYVRERREILQKMKMKNLLDDKIITDFAVVLDIALQAGSVDDRYYDLLRCMDSMARFETTGLR
ncbi:MAG: hypothetical protein HUJ76_08250 [Parasporobacterium sp.]|nr:hypothetical protein [Parasporobacterium sp.]